MSCSVDGFFRAAHSSLPISPAPSIPAIPAVSPAAFISLIAFALLAAVIIQGPLGLKAAFSGQDPTGSSGGTASSYNPASLSLTGLLDILSARLSTFPHGSASNANLHTNTNMAGVVPQMAGQGSNSDNNGHSQWNWYANPCKYHRLDATNESELTVSGTSRNS